MRRETTPSSTPNKSELRLRNENLGKKGNKQQPKSPEKRTKVYGQEENTPAGSANTRQVLGQSKNRTTQIPAERNREKENTGRNRTGSSSNAGGANSRGNSRKSAQPGARQSTNNKTRISRRRSAERSDTRRQGNNI